MASFSVSRDVLSCPVCLDLLKDPVTVPCGHSYCLKCITECWDQQDQKGIYSCPQCRETFTSRPVLRRSTMLMGVVENLKTTEQSSAETPRYAGPADVECDFCSEKKYKAVKSCLSCLLSYCEVHIQPHYEVPRLSKHKLVNATSQLQEKICSQHDKIIEVFCRTDQKLICVLCSMDDHSGHKTVSAAAERIDKQKKLGEKKKCYKNLIKQKEKELQQVQQALGTLQGSAQKALDESEKIFTEVIKFMEQKRSEVAESIRAQEKAEVSRAEGLLEQLEMEIAKLKSRDAEREQLLQIEDPVDFLKSFATCPPTPVSTSRIFTPRLSSTVIITPALKDIQKMLLKLRPGRKAEAPVSMPGARTVSPATAGHKFKALVSQSKRRIAPPAKRAEASLSQSGGCAAPPAKRGQKAEASLSQPGGSTVSPAKKETSVGDQVGTVRKTQYGRRHLTTTPAQGRSRWQIYDTSDDSSSDDLLFYW
ncbi:E3 ubiquitin/ISG15 ligase TRIM25-like [Engraulis encrasicolus]|uniref:E3 ubiquitin/ISG15 ligase TRIM25-like n=1 Tax=Engraulis encrasicolus TaxID=184585 RepID=UPI002FD2A53C